MASATGVALPEVTRPGEGRDRTAESRDRNAEGRDRVAEGRDQVAEARDRGADAHETGGPAVEERVNDVDAATAETRAADERHASHDRRGASADRARSAEDREAAASDRLSSAAQLVAERARSLRLTIQLGNLAENDPVTGLLTRSKFEQELDEHLARCARYGSAGALLMIRLDGLDTIGMDVERPEVDQVLASLAEQVVGRLRQTDVVGRWGPDELAVLLPVGDIDRAAPVADMLLDLVGAADRPPVSCGSLIASIGIAPVSGESAEAEHVVARASQAMAATRRKGGGAWEAR